MNLAYKFLLYSFREEKPRKQEHKKKPSQAHYIITHTHPHTDIYMYVCIYTHMLILLSLLYPLLFPSGSNSWNDITHRGMGMITSTMEIKLFFFFWYIQAGHYGSSHITYWIQNKNSLKLIFFNQEKSYFQSISYTSTNSCI